MNVSQALGMLGRLINKGVSRSCAYVASCGWALGELRQGGCLLPSLRQNLPLISEDSMSFTVYLSGEIHTSWREEIKQGAAARGLAVNFTSAVTDHAASDAAGDHLGAQDKPFWRDHQSAKVNAIRTKTLIEQADLVVVRFGDQYKQWNAAFDAGYCAALGTPYVTLHAEDIIHPLKEVDAAAMAWATTTEQVVEILAYVTQV